MDFNTLQPKKFYRLLLENLSLSFSTSWSVNFKREVEVKQRKQERRDRVRGESVCMCVREWGEKTEESKSSFPADFNLRAGWALQSRPYSSHQSRRLTARRQGRPQVGDGDGRTSCYVSPAVVCLWNMLSMLRRKWLSWMDRAEGRGEADIGRRGRSLSGLMNI